ncbi:MAG: peptidylprolyl isomerase [Candidatus Eremiobacteraeota bacterium]|nr:peptidylprolyl isomerase [Candidatus Eremiobacteraeota bacterium]
MALLAGCSANAASGDIASVNGQKVSRGEFDSKLEGGPQARQVLNSMVQGIMIDQYAKDNNIVISDADITKKEDEIKSKYPPGQFEQILKQQNLTESDVRNILREQLVLSAAVDKNIHISDKQIKDYLDKNHASLDKPEQAKAKHILVADQKTANMIESQLKGLSGKALDDKFQELAKKYSTDPSSKDKGGELGWFQKGQMVPAFQTAAWAQPIGVVGPPVKSPFGYHVIMVEGRKPPEKATFANSQNQIRDTLKQQQEQMAIGPFLQQLRAKANIVVYDDRLKDAIPPAATSGASTAPAPAPTKGK